MQRDGLHPDVVSYALLINAYGKARREDEALAVFEEMLDAGVRCVSYQLSGQVHYPLCIIITENSSTFVPCCNRF